SFHTFLSHDDLTYLLSFPTRRSSDLVSYFPQISNVFLADSTGRRCSSTIHWFCTSSTLAPLDVRAYLIPGNFLNSSGTPIHGLPVATSTTTPSFIACSSTFLVRGVIILRSVSRVPSRSSPIIFILYFIAVSALSISELIRHSRLCPYRRVRLFDCVSDNYFIRVC